MKPSSLTIVKREYDRLRKAYFLRADEPFHVPPKAAILRWGWYDKKCSDLAATTFDGDGDPYEVMLNPIILTASRFTTMIVMHELSHMRLGPKADCAKKSVAWRDETRRLAERGAFKEFY